MKKTLSVNLGGMVYHIDEDAYALLTDYLQDVRHHLGDEASSEEVLKDIEQRMSELFTEWMHGNREVVTKPDVERVVDILGRPEQYESEEAGTSGMGDASFAERPNDRRLRKLYRDPQNAILAGVCSGMGYYLNVGAVLPRLVFVLLTWFGGSGILLYLLCWIIIPEAKTAAQRLDMQGEDVTVENIEKKVREEYGKAKDRVGNYVNNAHIDQQARSIGYGIGQFFVTFFKIIFGFIAGVIGLVGFTVLLALIVALIAMWCGNVTVMVDAGVLNNVPATDIESVDVLKDPGNMGLIKFSTSDSTLTAIGGVVAIWTKLAYDVKPKSPKVVLPAGKKIDEDVRHMMMPGTKDTWMSQFPNPSRSNLWKPCVLTDEQGKASLKLVVPDGNGNLIIEISGVASDGSLVSHRIDLGRFANRL